MFEGLVQFEIRGAQESARPAIVLFIDGETFARFGAWIRYLLLGLADELFRVVVVAPREVSAEPWITRGARVVTYDPPRWPLLGNEMASLAASIEDAIAQEDVVAHTAVLHALSGAQAPGVLQVGARLNLPSVLSVCSLDDILPVRADMTRADAIVVAGEYLRQRLLAQIAPPLAPINCIPLGVAINGEANKSVRRGRTISLLVPGPHRHAQRAIMLIDAVSDAVSRGHDLMVFFLSAGPHEPLFRRTGRQHGISDRLTFVDIIDLLEFLSGADIWCLPEPPRACQVATLEAMARGVLVLAAEGGVDDAVIDQRTAACFPPDQPNRLLGRLLWILENPDAARWLADAGRDFVRRYRGLSSSIEALVRMYRELLHVREPGVAVAT